MLDGIWKNGSGKGRKTPKGRQYDDNALKEVEELLGNLELRSDLLIEHLHRVQDKFGHLSMRHLRALAELLKMSMAEVYEVATFYAHFDVVREDEKAPPALTIRVCDSLSCELAGSKELKAALEDGLDVNQVRVLRAPCMGRCDTAPTLEVGHNHIDYATVEKVRAAISSGDTNVKIPVHETLKTYMEKGGYSKLKSLEKSGNWQEVQETVLSAGLRGLGGAGFPSGKKEDSIPWLH